MDGVLIVAIIFGAITVWVRGFPSFGGRGRRAERRLLAEQLTEIKRLESVTGAYEERIKTLETIVCDVDYELNKKLSRLASQRLLALPAHAGGGVATADDAAGTAETALAKAAGAEGTSAAGGGGTPSGARRTGVLGAGARVAERFVIEELIGAGAMGEVYRAQDEKLGETVALKVMAGVSLLEPDAVERFRREAAAARRITHPNVVRMHDLGEDRGVHFLSMEHVEGESLRERLAREGALHVADARDVLRQVCDALEAAHATGVVHRDLKPDNILLDGAGQARIIDFGVARLPYLEGMTATGIVMGTPEYIAPEQVKGRPVDARADLYSLGAIAFHLLAGSPPFSGDSPIAVGFAHCNEPIPPLDEYRDLPDEWTRFIERALAKDPAERFQSAAEMRAALPSKT